MFHCCRIQHKKWREYLHNKIKANQYSADEINTLERVVISIIIVIHTCCFYCLKLLIKECKDRENIHFLFAFSAHFKKNEVSLSFKQTNNYRTQSKQRHTNEESNYIILLGFSIVCYDNATVCTTRKISWNSNIYNEM